MSEKYITINCTIKHATFRAVLIAVEGQEDVWIPRSTIHGASDRELENISFPTRDFNLQVMEWVAKKHGLETKARHY